jgi:hypothetical protein
VSAAARKDSMLHHSQESFYANRGSYYSGYTYDNDNLGVCTATYSTSLVALATDGTNTVTVGPGTKLAVAFSLWSTTANPPPITSSAAPINSSSSLSSGAKAGIAVGVVVGVLLLLGVLFFLFRRSRSKKKTTHEEGATGIGKNETFSSGNELDAAATEKKQPELAGRAIPAETALSPTAIEKDAAVAKPHSDVQELGSGNTIPDASPAAHELDTAHTHELHGSNPPAQAQTRYYEQSRAGPVDLHLPVNDDEEEPTTAAAAGKFAANTTGPKTADKARREQQIKELEEEEARLKERKAKLLAEA